MRSFRKPLSAVAPVSTVNNDAPVTIPRKQAPMSNVIDSMADLSDENYEEIQHTDGKVRNVECIFLIVKLIWIMWLRPLASQYLLLVLYNVQA